MYLNKMAVNVNIVPTSNSYRMHFKSVPIKKNRGWIYTHVKKNVQNHPSVKLYQHSILKISSGFNVLIYDMYIYTIGLLFRHIWQH